MLHACRYYPKVPTSLPQFIDRAHRQIAPPQPFPLNNDKAPSEGVFPPRKDLPDQGALSREDLSREDGSQKKDGSPGKKTLSAGGPETGKQREKAPASPGRRKANDKPIKMRVVDTPSTDYDPRIADGRGLCSYRSDTMVLSYGEPASLQQLIEPFNIASGTGLARDNLLQPDVVDKPPTCWEKRPNDYTSCLMCLTLRSWSNLGIPLER